jgi:hypothetical protein
MMKKLNRLINNIFKLLRFITYILCTLSWILVIPILLLTYILTGLQQVFHPYTILFLAYIEINRLWSKFIF